jgi:hypothetical protein
MLKVWDRFARHLTELEKRDGKWFYKRLEPPWSGGTVPFQNPRRAKLSKAETWNNMPNRKPVQAQSDNRTFYLHVGHTVNEESKDISNYL